MNRLVEAVCLFQLLFATSFAMADTGTETTIEAPGPIGPLQGVMVVPANPVQGQPVLIIPGSGPTDRDGNNPIGVAAATYKLLAETLAERGITSVRIDKRGLFGSAKAVSDPNNVTIADYASDVDAWVRTIRQKIQAKCIWLLGHSEGGLIALVAAQNISELCGLVLIAAPGRPMGDLLREQLKANPANASLLGPAFAAINSLENGKRVSVDSMPPALLTLFRPEIQGYMISLLSHDSARLLANYEKPVLILQGLRDLQITAHDAKRLKEANPRAELALLPEVNHVLKTVRSDDRTANLAAYANPALPLAPGIADTIARFVKAGPTAPN